MPRWRSPHRWAWRNSPSCATGAGGWAGRTPWTWRRVPRTRSTRKAATAGPRCAPATSTRPWARPPDAPRQRLTLPAAGAYARPPARIGQGDDVAVEAGTGVARLRPGRPLLRRLRVLRAAAAGGVGRLAVAGRRRRPRGRGAVRRAPHLVRAAGRAGLP